MANYCRSHCLRCSGRLADSCPSAGRRDEERTRSAGQQVIVAASLSCNRTAWATCEDDLVSGRVVPLGQSRRGRGSRTRPASQPGRGTGPGSRRPQRAAGWCARCQRGQHRQASPYAGGAAAGMDPWLQQPVLVILVRVLDQRPGRHLLVLEQVRRPDLNGFGLAPCGKDHRFVLEHLLIDVQRCA